MKKKNALHIGRSFPHPPSDPNFHICSLQRLLIIGVGLVKVSTLRILGMSWGVKTTCFEAPGVSLGGSGVSILGVKIVRAGEQNRNKLSERKPPPT